MAKRVLDVGQCGPDHAAISRLLRNGFGVEVDRAEGTEDSLSALAARDYALVLVNRKLDRDYSDGIEVLRSIRRRSEFDAIPVMLVSNFPEAHASAVAEGAVPGFGKDHLGDGATLSLLEPYLAE